MNRWYNIYIINAVNMNKIEGDCMDKWEGLGLNKAIMLKIMIVYVIVCFIISLIFQFQIKSNKIKPGKISRLFFYFI